MKLTKEDVMDFIPHRDPFLFIDSVESIEFPKGSGKEHLNNLDRIPLKELAGLEVKAKFKVSESMEVFKGHFPGNPVLPGVLQIEMMAQTACFGLRRLFKNFSRSDINLEVALVKVGESRFRKPILPGSELVIICRAVQVRGPMISFEGNIICEEEVMSESTFMASHNLSKQKEIV